MRNVSVKPEILRWARESIHLTREEVIKHFSKKSKKKFEVNAKIIQKCETEFVQIPFSLLKEFSALYKRPLAVFFLDKPPRGEPLPKDFRTLSSDVNTFLSPEIVLSMRETRRIQLIARELLRLLNIEFKFDFGKYTLSVNVDELAADIRNKFKFSYEEQKQIKSPRDFFNFLRNKIEEHGVLSIKNSFPIKDARAFSIIDEEPFIIVVNSKDGGGLNYTPKIFSLIHEFAHILLRESGVCNDFIRSHESVEKFCNQFAASFLVPTDFFEKELHNVTAKFQESEVEKYVENLQKVFKVSRPVILRRFLTFGFISPNFYEKKIVEWEEEYKRMSKEGKKFVPIVPRPLQVINNYGRSFTTLVLNAYRIEKITPEFAADCLSTSLKFLPALNGLV